MAKILLCGGPAHGRVVAWSPEHGAAIVVPTATVPPAWSPSSDKAEELADGLPTATYVIGQCQILGRTVWIGTEPRDPDPNPSILAALLKPELIGQGGVLA